jgi:hypothetical protein
VETLKTIGSKIGNVPLKTDDGRTLKRQETTVKVDVEALEDLEEKKDPIDGDKLVVDEPVTELIPS